MDQIHNKIHGNTAIARTANAANAELMPALKTCREECSKVDDEIRVVEDAIRKVQVEKAAAEQKVRAEENAKRTASAPKQPTATQLMNEIKQLKEEIASKD